MKTLQQKVAVMLAFDRGENIECRFASANGRWNATVHPEWNWTHYDYRIAPKMPREFTIVLHGGRPIGVACAGDVYIKLGDDVPVRETTTIRVREIVDEPAAELEISCKENFVCGGPPEYGFTLNRDTELPDKGQPGWTPGRRNPYR